jgi:hypothetical protein
VRVRLLEKHDPDEHPFIHEYFFLALAASDPYEGVFPEALVVH